MEHDSATYDVIVIGAGLGGLTAAAVLARHGRRVCVIEKNHAIGGAASTYRHGRLMIETALHETADPHDPSEPKHFVLKRLGLLGALDWVPVGPLYSVEGGPLGAEPFELGGGFDAVRERAAERFNNSMDPILDRMERVREAMARMMAARDPPSVGKLVRGLLGIGPVAADWRRTLGEVLTLDLDGEEAAKCALAANLPYYGADPARLWWIQFAVAQSGFIAAGGTFVRGGSQALTSALARVVTDNGGSVLCDRSAQHVVPPDGPAPGAVDHRGADGGDSDRLHGRAIVGNCAPHRLTLMLDEALAARFAEPYRHQPVSTSLFSIHFGVRRAGGPRLPRHYSTVLLPSSMSTFDEYHAAGSRLGSLPQMDDLPPLIVMNHDAIDSGLDPGGDLSLVTVTGIDRLDNWAGLDAAAAETHRRAWIDAIAARLDQRWPGFASAVEETAIHTAQTMHDYLGTPGGAVYGFAARPPERPIWFGMGRSPRTPLDGVFLASAYAGGAGYSGTMGTGAMAGDMVEAWLKKNGG